MRIIQVKFSNHTKLPVLVRDNSAIPVFLPLLYTILRLGPKSLKTKINIINAIKHLYKFCNENAVNIDELIINSDFDPVIDKMDLFSMWLYNRRYLEETDLSPISNQMFDINIRAVRDYLKWAANRYSKSPDISRIIDGKLTSHLVHITSRYRNINKGLTPTETTLLKQIILPGSALNPFKPDNQVRNWLMIEILLMTGLRCGELLKLKTTDIIKSGKSYY